MKKKKRLAILIPSIVIGSLCLLYFGGGYIAALIIPDAIFGNRLSTINDEKSFAKIAYYSQKDYPALNNRTEVTFASGDHSLTGYFYQAKEAKGTFVFAHGIHGYADDETAMIQNSILEAGYSLFAIDLTASGRSEGEGIKSLAQGAYDVKAALNYLFAQNQFYTPLSNLYLAGYSWGAYSVSASLNFGYPSKVSGVLCFSGFDNPEGEMIALARNYVGFLADMNTPVFDWGLATKIGDDRHLSGSQGILNSGAKAYLVQGDEDTVAPLSCSLYNALEDSPKVKRVLREGRGHSRPWLSESSEEATKTLQNQANQTDLETFEKNLDKETRASANRIDESLIEDALSFLTA